MDSKFWNDRYLENKTGWDIGDVSRPLKEYIDQLTDKSIRILIPGCGNAYEAIYLWKSGFKNVFLLDIAPEVLRIFAKNNPDFPSDQIICGDFFKHDEQYDLILEQTFFCALDPSLRTKYVLKMSEMLSAKGRLVGLLFNTPFEGGPPFGGDKEEYLNLFKDSFEVLLMENSYNSIEPRSNAELFFMMKLKQ